MVRIAANWRMVGLLERIGGNLDNEDSMDKNS
jgi:hypothetical protein